MAVIDCMFEVGKQAAHVHTASATKMHVQRLQVGQIFCLLACFKARHSGMKLRCWSCLLSESALWASKLGGTLLCHSILQGPRATAVLPWLCSHRDQTMPAPEAQWTATRKLSHPAPTASLSTVKISKRLWQRSNELPAAETGSCWGAFMSLNWLVTVVHSHFGPEWVSKARLQRVCPYLSLGSLAAQTSRSTQC